MNDKNSLKWNKIIVLICGFISTGFGFVISTLGGNLIQISNSLYGAIIAPLLGLFLLSLLFSTTTSLGAIFGFLIGFVCSMWLSIGAFIIKPRYPQMPVSIDDCIINNKTQELAFIIANRTTLLDSKASNLIGFETFYSMSYMWYTTFGVLITIISGFSISLLSGGLWNKVDRSLVLFDLSINRPFQKK